jgi:hypothetical protein
LLFPLLLAAHTFIPLTEAMTREPILVLCPRDQP